MKVLIEQAHKRGMTRAAHLENYNWEYDVELRDAILMRNAALNSLPYGCSSVRERDGVNFYYCAGIWCRPGYQGIDVVYNVDDIGTGVNADVEFEDQASFSPLLLV